MLHFAAAPSHSPTPSTQLFMITIWVHAYLDIFLTTFPPCAATKLSDLESRVVQRPGHKVPDVTPDQGLKTPRLVSADVHLDVSMQSK